MDINTIASGLHPLEREVLPYLKGKTDIGAICRESGMLEVSAVRALGWMEEKGIVKLIITPEEIIDLDINGKECISKGMPEKRFLSILKTPLSLQEIEKASGLSAPDVASCLGILKQKQAIKIEKKDKLIVEITDAGKALLNGKWPEEDFLKKLPAPLGSLDKKLVGDLRSRAKIIKIETKKHKSAELTDLGKQLKNIKIEDTIDKVTPELIKSGDFKGKTFRSYDINAPSPPLYPGKLHHYRSFLDNVRKTFQSLGFEEMSGPLVESDFWDMDALYMPQFHSAREIHEAYYVKKPAAANVEKKFLDSVSQMHEKGGNGSEGWKYKFDFNRTLRTVLRTQGTACSARKLASKDLKIPGKYFGIARCFRYDVIDATHLPDFNQMEGIVVEENLNFRHLIGLLKMFAKVFAKTSEIKVVPGYFPFTEPSAELFAKHPKLGWVELGGAGLFRPEVVHPLTGRNISVIAWGLGVDRLGMFDMGIKDIRDLFTHDLEVLRNAKVV